ncbi:hypothetical protein PV10_01504 [Exophiala mesophila]|uniref:Chromosome transmission fidelity protein 8 n=1 Tax=Exophiala mesophila TaxID=212818 RepID=A0A0D1ZT85_EXOME|nr:uncharacterized protein PV10_01504 [Exophiala mesophila]KIV97797.1 hypothetical protein PV10_01504 [Exophiala mesophila]
MPSIDLFLDGRDPGIDSIGSNPLPYTLQTPSGLAIVEIQGTIHTPMSTAQTDTLSSQATSNTPIGRLEFPFYENGDQSEGKWMKRVYLYVGKHQRLTGEVKKLPKPLGVLRKRPVNAVTSSSQVADESSGDLDLVDVIKYKLLFSGRPEPVGE